MWQLHFSEEYTVATVHRRYNDERISQLYIVSSAICNGRTGLGGVIFRSRNTLRNQIGLCIGVVRCGT
jgi:hypothetical protein